MILGHTSESDFSDTEGTPKSLRELEAEAVALLCCEALNLEGAEFCRGYIQEWLKRMERAQFQREARKRFSERLIRFLRRELFDAIRQPLMKVAAFYQT